jgi:hypothetical protein
VQRFDVDFEGFEHSSRGTAHIIQKGNEQMNRVRRPGTKRPGDVAHPLTQQMEILERPGIRKSLPLIEHLAKSGAILLKNIADSSWDGPDGRQEVHAP